MVNNKEITSNNKQEEVDIDLNDPDVENAACKIQAGFKGMKARKEVSELKANKTETVSWLTRSLGSVASFNILSVA